MKLLQRKAEEPKEEAPWPYSMPAGYQWATDEDAYVPLICRRCGAATVHSGVNLHDAWHASLDA